jgi:hypothetical protein
MGVLAVSASGIIQKRFALRTVIYFGKVNGCIQFGGQPLGHYHTGDLLKLIMVQIRQCRGFPSPRRKPVVQASKFPA